MFCAEDLIVIGAKKVFGILIGQFLSRAPWVSISMHVIF
jgi:hypothetical protein